jgi:hypothetical protein
MVGSLGQVFRSVTANLEKGYSILTHESTEYTARETIDYHTDPLNRCVGWMQKLMPFSTLTSEFVGDKL